MQKMLDIQIIKCYYLIISKEQNKQQTKRSKNERNKNSYNRCDSKLTRNRHVINSTTKTNVKHGGHNGTKRNSSCNSNYNRKY